MQVRNTWAGAPLAWLRGGWLLGPNQQRPGLGQEVEWCSQAGAKLKPGQGYRVAEVQTSTGGTGCCILVLGTDVHPLLWFPLYDSS